MAKRTTKYSLQAVLNLCMKDTGSGVMALALCNPDGTPLSAGGGGSLGIPFTLRGNAYVGVNQTGMIMPGAGTISKVVITTDVAPTDASLIVDVNKNGTTIFTDQDNRPTITTGNTTADSGTPDVTALVEGDKVTIDVDQIGSTIPGGAHLYIAVVFS